MVVDNNGANEVGPNETAASTSSAATNDINTIDEKGDGEGETTDKKQENKSRKNTNKNKKNKAKQRNVSSKIAKRLHIYLFIYLFLLRRKMMGIVRSQIVSLPQIFPKNSLAIGIKDTGSSPDSTAASSKPQTRPSHYCSC